MLLLLLLYFFSIFIVFGYYPFHVIRESVTDFYCVFVHDFIVSGEMFFNYIESYFSYFCF